MPTQINILNYGADPTGVVDSSTAINNAIIATASAQSSSAPEVVVPRGTYKLSSPIRVAQQVRLTGVLRDQCILKPDRGVTAIIVDGWLTNPPGRGDYSIISNLYLLGPEAYNVWNGPNADGILVCAPCTIQNVYISFFQRYGIYISGGSAVINGTTFVTNANMWRVQDCIAAYCGQSGLYSQGGDSNAGTSISFYGVGCGQYGLHDDSFLGNTHIGTYVAENNAGAIRSVQANGFSSFIGCFTESGSTSYINTPSIVIGGDHGSPVVGTAAVITNKAYNVSTPFSGTASQVGYIKSFTGEMLSSQANSLISFSNSNESANIGLDYGVTSYHIGFYSLRLKYLNEIWGAFLIAGGGARMATSLRPIVPGKMVIKTDSIGAYTNEVMGYYLGDVLMSSASDVPAYGNWESGDRSYNDNYPTNTYQGWICTVPGTVGATYTEGLTASATTGIPVFTLSSTTTVLVPGRWLMINGKRVRQNQVIPWTANTVYQVTSYEPQVIRSNYGYLYQLHQNGTSSTTGPFGTGMIQVDGTARWDFVGYVGLSFPYTSFDNQYIPTGSGFAISYASATFVPMDPDASETSRGLMSLTSQSFTGEKKFTSVALSSGDSSASPGDATLNFGKGRSAMASGASIITITNDKVTSASDIFITLMDIDATAITFKAIAGTGSFVVTANAAATANVKFRWMVVNG